MGVKLQAASGGSVELVPTNTASNFTVTVPAVTASVLTDSAGILNIGSGQVYKDASGNLLVGTTSNPSAAKLVVSQGSSRGMSLEANISGTSFQIMFRNTNGEVGNISTNGSTTSYTTSSDYRLKNTIAPMTGALDKVALLKPCTYKWNADGSDGQGFIAHELQEVVGGCVTGEKDAVDADGKPQYQGIDTSFLVATLTAAIQEQQALIVQLQADVAALKGAQA